MRWFFFLAIFVPFKWLVRYGKLAPRKGRIWKVSKKLWFLHLLPLHFFLISRRTRLVPAYKECKVKNFFTSKIHVKSIIVLDRYVLPFWLPYIWYELYQFIETKNVQVSFFESLTLPNLNSHKNLSNRKIPKLSNCVLS